MAYISQSTSDIRFMNGTDNSAADALSIMGVNLWLSTQSLQQPNALIPNLHASEKHQTFEDIWMPDSDIIIICDMSIGYPASSFQSFYVGQSSTHITTYPTVYFWQGSFGQVSALACGIGLKTCFQSQRSKIHPHTITSLGTSSPPDALFRQNHIDVVGPLPQSYNYRYIVAALILHDDPRLS